MESQPSYKGARADRRGDVRAKRVAKQLDMFDGQPARTVPRSVLLATVLALVLGFFLIQPYAGTVLFSALVAFIFNPVYQLVVRRTKRRGLAVLATFAAAVLSFILPLLVVVAVTVGQVNALLKSVDTGQVDVGSAHIEQVVDRGATRLQAVVEALPGGASFTPNKQKIHDKLTKLAGNVLEGIVNLIKRAGGLLAGLIPTTILAATIITNLLLYQREVVGFLRGLSPFRDETNDLYLRRVGDMTKAMVKGQLIIAAIQGFASSASLWLMGIDYFGFFLLVLTFLSFIPLGAGIVTIPIGIILIFSGNVWQGLFIILFHLLGVTNIDNLLRPRLVPRSARLNPALTMLAVFAGLVVFGAMGIIYGPVVMIVVVTTLEMYAEYNRLSLKPSLPAPATPPKHM
jgi:predicted PurR-regulated permease PerM